MGSNSSAIQANCRLKDGNAVRIVLPSDYRDAMVAMQEKLVNVEIRDLLVCITPRLTPQL